jgi:hypothetical protein
MNDALVAMARDVIDGNRYLTLGTAEPDGMPRLSPVYFTHDAYRTFYWISEPAAQHSANVARHPTITAVIFDSSKLPGTSEAVYLTATARQVPDDALAAECTVAFRNVGDRGGRPFAPAELSGAAPLRLFRADATSFAVHIRGSHPTFGTGTDKRMSVDMPV